MSGLLVVDKPAGMTSHDVVARLRRALGTRRVGHAGTLDPMATGVLVVGVDRATRLLGHLALDDKRYLATVRLGSATVTDDREGAVVDTADPATLAAVTDDAIRAAAGRLTGPLLQVPSTVSAIKVDGQRAHARVRAGEEVVLAARPVVVSRLDVLAVRREPAAIDVDIDVECSSGTYVRALARDLGRDLGVGGHLVSLRRVRVGPFDAPVPLDDAVARGAAGLLDMGEVAALCFPVWTLDEAAAVEVAHGRRIPWAGPAGSGDRVVALLAADGRLLALARDEDGVARYLAVLA